MKILIDISTAKKIVGIFEENAVQNEIEGNKPVQDF